MLWVQKNVRHPHLVGPTPPDRAMSEEALIDSGRGWCNEQSRVFIALCQVMQIPARLCFLFHANQRCGHTATEVWLNDKWSFFDVTFNVRVALPDGTLAEARELSGQWRELAHEAYRAPMRDYAARMLPFVDEHPGWCPADRPDPNRSGDLLAVLGICNYIIEGAKAENDKRGA